MRLLFVEESPPVAFERYGKILRSEGFAIDLVEDAESADAAITTVDYGLVFVGRRRLGGDAISYLRRIRRRHRQLPMVLLNAVEGRPEDRAAALNGGADDVVCTSMRQDELLARVRAILRRPATCEADQQQHGNLVFDFVLRSASVGGVPIRLARRELGILECLMRAKGRVLPRHRLEESLYGFNEEISANAIDVAIHRLRGELRRAEVTSRITTVRGVGYVLEA